MIHSRKELKEYIALDNAFSKKQPVKWKIISHYTRRLYNDINRFLYYLRKQEYYINTAQGSKIKGFLGLYFERRKNRLGNRIGLEVPPNCLGKGVTIYHTPIVVNAACKIGDGCKLHGNNCIGHQTAQERICHCRGDYRCYCHSVCHSLH